MSERGLSIVMPRHPRPAHELDADALATVVRNVLRGLPLVRDGRDGKSMDTDAVVSAITAAAQALLAAMPADGKDGRDGRDGLNVEPYQWRFDVHRRQDGLIDYIVAKPIT